MSTPQGGIFALGTSSHAYLEFDALEEQRGGDLVDAISALREPWTTMGGVNLVAGFRPELWREVVPDDAPPDVHGFNEDLVGVDGYVMPATQHDAVLGSRGARTTSSSTRRARRSPRCEIEPRSRRRPRAGPTGTTWT
jgi:porphyrinogen peroxidase